MKRHLSALMDGELEAHEVTSLLAGLSHDEGLQADWHSYHLIGDALRQEGNLRLDISARVMTALQNEPTVLAPSMRSNEHARARSPWRAPMALAASLAGVSVVAWLAIAEAPVPTAEKMAATSIDRASVKPVAAAISGNMQEYLVAHQTHSLSGQMQSGTLYIRTVSAER